MYRLFSVVLAKLLRCGDQIDAELYNWRTESLIDLNCDLSSYKKLVTLCHKGINATFAASFIRSICIYDFVKPAVTPKRKTVFNNIESLSIIPPEKLWTIQA